MAIAAADHSPAPPAADLLAALPVAVLLLDPEGCVAGANAVGEQLLGRSRRALLGVSIGAVLPGLPDRPDDFAAFDTAIPTVRGPVRADVASAALAGHPGWRVATLHPAAARGLDRPDATRAAVGAAAMLAHEIKNPLSGIRGAAQLLGRGELTDLIVREVDRIAGLIDRMEGFTDERPLPLAPLNVHEVLAHVRQLAAAGFARDVRFEERFDPSLPDACANRDALVQALLNLVKNAAEAIAGRPGRRIVLASAYRHGPCGAPPGGHARPTPIEIAVLDDGPGAPPAIAEHLFAPFVSGRAGGQGLGLALVDKLVRDMGGLVRHAREGDPPMTAFRILLPRAA